MMEVELENIGGLVGKHRFVFKEGVNEVLAPNAIGKTSLVRAIVSMLAPISPGYLLNLDAEEGYIKLVIDGKEYLRKFKRKDGAIVEVETKPLARDEKLRYLVLDPELGVISRKIMVERDADVTDYIIKVFRLDEIREEIENLRREREVLAKKKDYLEAEVRELRERSRDKELLERQKEEIQRKLESLEAVRIEEVKSIEDRMAGLERRLASINVRIHDIKNRIIPNLIERIKDYESELTRLKTIINDFYLQHREPEKEIDELRARIKEADALTDKFERELKEKYGEPVSLVLKAYEAQAEICPVCGRPVEKPSEFWKKRIDRLESIRKDYEERLKRIAEERSRLWTELEELQKKFNEIRELKELKLPNLEMEYKRSKEQLKNYEKEIEKLEAEKNVILRQLEDLRSRLTEEQKKHARRRAELERQLGIIEQKLKDLDEIIRARSRAGEELVETERRLKELDELIEAEERNLYETISKMADEFVRTANRVVKELGFEWLKGIRLARVQEEGKERYFVRVIRVFPSGREREQPLELLSTSERLVVSLVTVLVGYRLKIAEEYGDEVPIIADEALLALDPERFNKTVQELRKYSKYVIITRLADPSEVPELTVRHIS
mgnify:CR=1 FL=1